MKKRIANVLGRCLLLLIIFALFATGCESLDTEKASNSENEANIGENIKNNENLESPPNTDDKKDDDNENTGDGLESGFVGSEEINGYFIAYRSDRKEFDINDVTLEFSYGGWFIHHPDGTVCQCSQNYPYFDIYFTNEDGGKIFVKRVEENFVSEKYNCKLILDENRDIVDVEFNHSEILTIPKEIFTREKGIIWISFYGEDVSRDPVKYDWFAGNYIHYKVEGDMVYLSTKEFR